MKIIGMVGTRKRDRASDYRITKKKFFEIYEPGDWLCSGGCSQGGDRFADKIAKYYGIPILIFYPNKSKLPKDAKRWNYREINYERNTLIAETSNVIIACVTEDRKGGTEDTLEKFSNKKIKGQVDLVWKK